MNDEDEEKQRSGQELLKERLLQIAMTHKGCLDQEDALKAIAIAITHIFGSLQRIEDQLLQNQN